MGSITADKMNLQLCLFFAKLYQLAVPCAAKTFSAGKQVHRVNQIGLTLGIFAVDHIYIVKIQHQVFQIAVGVNTHAFYLHCCMV